VSGAPCDIATVENTRRVFVEGGGGQQSVVLDESKRPLASPTLGRVKVNLALGEGDDVLVLLRSGADDKVAIGSGRDVQGITVTGAPTRRDIALDGATEVVKVRAGRGADVVSAAGSPIVGDAYGGRVVVFGEGGRDRVVGGRAPDRLVGGRGGDVITGGPSSDALMGAAGPDRLLGEGGGDRLRGGAGTDSCYQYGGRGIKRSCQLPKSRSPLPRSPLRQLLIVNQNVREVHPRADDSIFPWLSDLQSHKEIGNFARRLPRWVPYAPDVAVLQEANRNVAKLVAAALERVLKQSYKAVVRPTRALRLIATREGLTLDKMNTVVIINQRTTRFLRGGYLKTAQFDRDRGELPLSIQRQAHALVKEKGTRMRAAVAAIHFSSNRRFSSNDFGFRRRVQWSEKVARFLRDRYPGANVRIMAGEYATRRCMDVRWERVTCDESRLWSVMTRDFGYDDAVYVANNSSNADIREQQTSNHGHSHRIDYIFAKGRTLSASRDVHYEAYKGDRHFISDHKGDFALIGRR
jgi:hypothetical protein